MRHVATVEIKTVTFDRIADADGKKIPVCKHCVARPGLENVLRHERRQLSGSFRHISDTVHLQYQSGMNT
jgi:hypothetical protein